MKVGLSSMDTGFSEQKKKKTQSTKAIAIMLMLDHVITMIGMDTALKVRYWLCFGMSWIAITKAI